MHKIGIEIFILNSKRSLIIKIIYGQLNVDSRFIGVAYNYDMDNDIVQRSNH